MDNQQKTLSYSDILKPIENQLKDVEEVILKHLETDISLLSKVSRYILTAGGKRFRPAVLLLAAGAVGEINYNTYVAASVVEHIHTATLLHDDVVDNADIRRSKKAARSIWGNELSVLVGDYLFTVSFKYMAELGDLELITALSSATTKLAQGEIIQLDRDNQTATEEEYLKIIDYKTASLIGVSMQIGGMLGGADAKQKLALHDCGTNIGMAFQIVDDALDYDVGNIELGKQPGTDLKERKITLPLSHVLENGSALDRNTINGILDADIITDDHVKQVYHLMKEYGSIKYSLQRARTYAEKAKACLEIIDESQYKTAIKLLADFIIDRKK